jgi:hypothetical protein
MAQDRSADAAKVFERTVALAGRQPELLGQWWVALSTPSSCCTCSSATRSW